MTVATNHMKLEAAASKPRTIGSIAIVGDGVAGVSLHHILKQQGISSDIFGIEHHNRCGIRGCGYGISDKCFDLINDLGLKRTNLYLGYRGVLYMDGRPMTGHIYSFDKAAFIKSLSDDVWYGQFDPWGYDLVVIATGLPRLSASVAGDKIAYNYQCRVATEKPARAAFDMIPGGYLWTIPLGDSEAHIGGGSTTVSLDEVARQVKERIRRQRAKVICSCAEPIRLSGPIWPLVNGNTVYIGEAAGLVVPFGGGGIHPSLTSAAILSECIGRYGIDKGVAAYDNEVRRRFGWLVTSRRLLDHLECGEVPFRYLPAAYKALRYQGLNPTLADLWYIRKRIQEVNGKTDAVSGNG